MILRRKWLIRSRFGKTILRRKRKNTILYKSNLNRSLKSTKNSKISSRYLNSITIKIGLTKNAKTIFNGVIYILVLSL